MAKRKKHSVELESFEDTLRALDSRKHDPVWRITFERGMLMACVRQLTEARGARDRNHALTRARGILAAIDTAETHAYSNPGTPEMRAYVAERIRHHLGRRGKQLREAIVKALEDARARGFKVPTPAPAVPS